MEPQPGSLSQMTLYLVFSLLTLAIGWLAKTVIALKADLQSLDAQHHAFMDETYRIQTVRDSDTNRRFADITASLQQINAKLDRLVERKN